MADKKTVAEVEAENAELLNKVAELEGANAELELKLAALEGAAMEKTPAKVSKPEKPVKVGGKTYKWAVASIRHKGEIVACASLSKEEIEEILEIEGQGLLVEQK